MEWPGLACTWPGVFLVKPAGSQLPSCQESGSPHHVGPGQRKYAKMMRGNPTGLKQKLALRHSHLVKCNAVPIHYFLLVPHSPFYSLATFRSDTTEECHYSTYHGRLIFVNPRLGRDPLHLHPRCSGLNAQNWGSEMEDDNDEEEGGRGGKEGAVDVGRRRRG